MRLEHSWFQLGLERLPHAYAVNCYTVQLVSTRDVYVVEHLFSGLQRLSRHQRVRDAYPTKWRHRKPEMKPEGEGVQWHSVRALTNLKNDLLLDAPPVFTNRSNL